MSIRNNKGKLKDIRCFLLDMDGTFYLGDQLLPGAKEFLDWLNARRIQYLFLTNNSSKNVDEYANKFQRLGLDVPKDKIFTSGEATCIYLNKIKPGANIYLAGTPALEEEFKQSGFILVQEHPEYIVLGFDTSLTYAKLWKLCDFVRAGLPYLATHPDFNCPTEDGFMPDVGSMIALIAASTGRQPDVVIGKPNKPMIDAIVQITGVPVEQTAMVGDRLYTDVAMGKKGIFTILVLSGETTLDEARNSPFQAELVVNDLADLVSRMS
jgi:4-nitrophenyl phosphatase/NagD protein